MGWSISIGKIFGINFRIHITFLLLLIFIYMSALPKVGVDGAIKAVFFICAIFACVLIHELSHSLIAKRFGKEAKSILLLPIGGVAMMEEMPEKPVQEILMAFAGPLINLIIAGILFIIFGNWSGISVPNLYPDSIKQFMAGLIGVNIMLAIFNLIPAFPMDGGRMLRGIFALKMEYSKATSLAVSIGQGISLLFIFWGIFYNWWLALIGVFLFIGAGSEKKQVILRSLLRGVKAKDVMITDFRMLHPNDKLSKSLEHISHGCQADFPVKGDKKVEGLITRDQILSAIHKKGVDASVSEIMKRDFYFIEPNMTLDEIYNRLHTSNNSSAMVMDNGNLKGIISLDAISRYFMIQAALRRT